MFPDEVEAKHQLVLLPLACLLVNGIPFGARSLSVERPSADQCLTAHSKAVCDTGIVHSSPWSAIVVRLHYRG